jgi:hypothetical protein
MKTTRKTRKTTTNKVQVVVGRDRIDVMVHDSKARVRTLAEFILCHVTHIKSAFNISAVKRDGTVFVKFTSSTVDPASWYVRRFREELVASGRQFEEPGPCQFRLALDQFSA